MAVGTLFVRQRTLAECLKRRRVIPETDSEEEEGGGVSHHSSEGKSRVELALEGIWCGCGQNFAPQYPAVIYNPNRKSPGASIRGVGCQRASATSSGPRGCL
jgi:hypothetical protein